MTDMTTIQIALSTEERERLKRIEDMLRQLLPEERLWTTKDVAEFLNVTEETVRVKVRKGELPTAARAGNRMRFDPATIRGMK